MKTLVSIVILTLASSLPLRAESDAPAKPSPHRIASLSAEEKAQLEQQLNEAWNKLPLESKQRLMRFNRALREMSPEDRKFIHDRVERFVTMPPEERDRLRENRERWQKMTPEEREKARQEFRKKRTEFEQQWRAEHPDEEPPPFRPRPPRPPPPPEGEPTQPSEPTN